jgi:hypothetical protein
MTRVDSSCLLVLTAILLFLGGTEKSFSENGLLLASSYPSLQAAIDANPGKMIQVPPGDYEISQSLLITQEGTGLYGYGRIIQTNPDTTIIRIDGTSHVRIDGLTLTRPEGKTDSTQEGIVAVASKNVEMIHLQVMNHRSKAGAIVLRDSEDCTIRDCLVENYKTITVDDRTDDPRSGYAFKCIDGTGIILRYSNGTLIEGNRIVEKTYLPTQECKEKYHLGEVTIMPKEVGPFTPKDIFETKYTNNWHQGSGILVTGLGDSHHTILTGNYIENPAQGIDIHSDYITVTNNIIRNAMIGMKAMHGSRHVLISNNQFNRVDLWGILLMPGAGSHAAEPAKEGKEVRAANTDGGTVVANNIITEFGLGDQYWNWVGRGELTCNAISIQGGQLLENPPLRDVLIQGNVVYDDGRDQVIVEGKPQVVPPRFKYSIYVEREKKPIPENILIQGNLFHRGSQGFSNIDLDPSNRLTDQ